MSKYRILSLDGGGIRGLMTAVWLKRLREKLSKPLHHYFDLVAGTSTGAMLACAVSKGLDPDEIIDLYMERGRKVFPSTSSRLWSRATRVFSDGLSAPKYDGKGLESELRSVFKTSTFGGLRIKPTLVTTYDVFGRQAVVFKNTNARFKKLKVWEICRASAAAPTYFPAHVLNLDGADVPLVDGGVVANNPTACAIAEGVKINQTTGIGLEDFVVASFGTGESIRRIDPGEAKEWGAAQWAIPIIDVLFDGSADSVDYISSQLVAADHYFRFQTRLTDAYDDMDNADRTNLNALIRIANQYIDNDVGGDMLDSLAGLLD